MSTYCPYAPGLDCDIFYRCDECYSQAERNREVTFYGKPKCSCRADVCEADPKLCPKYLKYTQAQKVR